MKASLIQNLDILRQLGCLDDDGMANLRTGNAPTITKGPHAGDMVAFDQAIPLRIAGELDQRLYNLRFMAPGDNIVKSDTVARELVNLARKWHFDGLISDEGLKAVSRSTPQGGCRVSAAMRCGVSWLSSSDRSAANS